ncbi:Fpg/Nei family DNA glycosylase [Pimelobacter simplex]|uniref:DNA-(apurinic or apyrimidinic site) lyase n=1 Tax=Nocardioides simplex TaxID=2045 RepID=A0A0A1DPL7_NOCSI|nr:zinc finger domain-containing protein [Pimelobacter simplex]AIY18512.1 Formamidopyrimidine-DNA glycosylase [Pimelobacter simplex]MCG8153336.1 Fpg/Nei family DNA glycosylase [Pimelobacter simplex]GEB14132.1 endonuclease VIII [Pimelobacter simplex]SFM33340.1 endonuclease-8 [Pimelobacter simplex]
MPEGHTLHRLAGELTTVFGGHQVQVGSPQGRFADSAAHLDGTRLLDAEAWGKQLFVRFEGERFVHVHLGLYGTFEVRADVPEIPLPIGQVRLRLARPGAYGDLRGATTCALVTAAERAAVVAKAGPDPLRADADPDRAWARISRSSAPIGTLLMDQTVLAGVGNVYRAEVLFRHRIHPLRPGRTLRVSQWRAIWDDLVVLMAEGVRSGRIDTVRPEHTPEAMGRAPRVDDHGGEVYVYRRTGQPCHVCGGAVRTEVLGGRNLFWCPRCQPTFRSRAAR